MRLRADSRAAVVFSVALAALGAVMITPPAAATEDYEEPEVTERDREHWSFQPVARPEVPALSESASVLIINEIDSFLLKKLNASGLTFSPEADRETLLRRLSFDLTGLPPTPEEVDAFLADREEGAYERVVARLLNSPHYGERWAQHWLDVARFAESDGFEHDKVRHEAWRYRDWVIDALNRDVPYDGFVRLQIAGDEIAAGDEDAAIATGFLVAGPDMPDINLTEERRHNLLNDMTATVGSTFLGLTMGCATCHDHKSDPISQADFYRLRAFFDNTNIPERDKQMPPSLVENGPDQPESFLMVRGDFRRPGPELKPAFIRVANLSGQQAKPHPTKVSSGYRRELADWIASPENPLTARVMVNRLWMHHFVQPLVATPNDFGKLGATPTHPELLDWLASEFIARGWSLKEMHRLMVTSRAYRQASQPVDLKAWNTAKAADPENALLWRMNARRLSGEALRDALLSASGTLNEKPHGPGVRPPLPPEVTLTLLKNQWPVTEDLSEHSRRSIYLFVRRNLRYPMFDVFDRPDGNASCARRHVSTTAPQSLTLLNDPFCWDMAQTLAERVSSERRDPRGQIALAYRLVLSHRADSAHLNGAEDFCRENSLAAYCLALFNLNAFVYVD